jgi:hypothetical protein
MKLFKGSRDKWFVLTNNAKEKKQLFKTIPKRDPVATYFHPDGTREWQYPVSVKEADKVNYGQIC